MAVASVKVPAALVAPLRQTAVYGALIDAGERLAEAATAAGAGLLVLLSDRAGERLARLA